MRKSKKKKDSGSTTIKSGKPAVDLPFRNSDYDDDENQDQEIQKTRIGIQAEIPSGDQSNSGASHDEIICPKCQYPLRTQPAESAPCPNCGYSGDERSKDPTQSDSGKTRPVSTLEDKSEIHLTEFKFKLIEESSNSEIIIESEEPEMILNREHLDPDNTSISSDQHVVVRFREGKIFITDVSSNGATFVQAKDQTVIQDGTRLVLGNKIYIFRKEGELSQQESKATRRFGEFDLTNQETTGFILTEEHSQNSVSFKGNNVTVNRTNLDPDNNSLSSSQHADFKYKNNQWHITDLSKYGSTFVQILAETRLENKIKIIIGNRIYRLELE